MEMNKLVDSAKALIFIKIKNLEIKKYEKFNISNIYRIEKFNLLFATSDPIELNDLAGEESSSAF